MESGGKNGESVAAWDGFEPYGYELDSNRIWGLPIVLGASTNEGKQGTVGDAIKSIDGAGNAVLYAQYGDPVRDGECYLDTLLVQTVLGERAFIGSFLSLQALHLVADIYAAGVSPWATELYYFSGLPRSSGPFHFFVVSNDGIVCKAGGKSELVVSLSKSSEEEFDPRILEPLAEWKQDHAWAKWWYRKFYAETRIGQMQVLCEDHEPLFYYPEGYDIRRAVALHELKAWEHRPSTRGLSKKERRELGRRQALRVRWLIGDVLGDSNSRWGRELGMGLLLKRLAASLSFANFLLLVLVILVAIRVL